MTTTSFIERMIEHIEAHPEKALLVEMHGRTEVPTRNADTTDRIARARGALREHGVARGDRVVLIAPNSARWIAADLAILAEGAICVPMYARQAPAELVQMTRDADARLVIAGTDELAEVVTDELAKNGGTALPVVKYSELFGAEPVTEPVRGREPSDVVTIIYTSGTSGVAKGAMLTRGNVDSMLPNVVSALERLMGKKPGTSSANDRVFHYLPFCFAGSRIVLFTCLYRDVPIRMSTDLEQLKDELAGARPSYVLNVPALLERIKNGVEAGLSEQPRAVQALYASAKDAYQREVRGAARLADGMVLTLARTVVFRKIKERIGSNLECLICGSAPLGEDTQRWFEMLGIPVYQVYGLTETTAIVTMDEPRAAKPGRVGHAIPRCELKIAEDGELLVKGPNVFPGYWRRETETRDAFDADGWLKTGDAAEVDHDGNYRIIGRTKNILVPTSGHNIAPEPLEQLLVEGIRGAEHAVVFGHGRPFLTAVISGKVADSEVATRIEDVNKSLPHYRRIRKWVVTKETFTPDNGLLTANQKLRRRALENRFAPELDQLYR